MSITFDFHPAALLLSVLLAGLLAFWMYIRSVPRVEGGKRVALVALRFLTLALVLFLLADPVIRRFLRETKPPVLALLLDQSQSMNIDAGSGEQAAEDVRSSLGDLVDNAGSAQLRVFTFGQDLVDATGLPTDSLQFESARTNISRALVEARERLRSENLQGVVLVSDGRYNSGRNPSFVAQEYPVPIHTVVVGDTSRHVDVQIHRVTTNEVAYVGSELPVRVSVRSEGFGGRRVSVGIYDDGTLLDGSSVTLPEGGGEISLDLGIVPGAEGLRRYSVRVDALPGEITTRNNVSALSVRVLQRRVSLLLLAGAPSPDVAAFKQLFAQDNEVTLETYTQKSATEFYEGAPPASFDGFDAILLIGFPGRHTPADLVNTITTASRNGAPLLFVLDRGTNLQLVRSNLGDAIPVTLRTIRGGFVEAGMVPTLAGRAHPVLDLDAPEDGWDRLPPIFYNQSRWDPTPDARTLATVSLRSVSLEDPLLIVRSRSRVRTAAVLASGMWRWHNLPGDLEGLRTLWPELMSNVIQWLTTREDDRPVRVSPVQDLFSGGEAVQFSGQVYDESLDPVDGAAVELQVVGEDGTRFDYNLGPIGNGRYLKSLGSLPEGGYSYRASASLDGAQLGTDSGEFAVGALRVEYRETRSDAALMGLIARRSGGRSLTPASLPGFIPELEAEGLLSERVIRTERDEELRRRFVFLGIIVLLLTTEWVLRKRSGMV